ncbi:MAG TPA: hypothetical protein VIY48_18395 [Candidatus Paceibacterota bacterium]
MSKWWDQDTSDAGQGLFADPTLALQIATMPLQQLKIDQAAEDQARQARGGFMKQTMSFLGSAGHALDGALSNVPGWGVTKGFGKALWYPVDKTASGAYWLYSNAVSQPLSTLMLMAATSQGGGIGGTSYFSAHDWADSWHKANAISPMQVAFNYENTMAAKGTPGFLAPLLGDAGANLSKEEKEQVSRQSDKFLNDTDFWRSKAGWKYTVGTGVLDGMTSLGLDPAYGAIKVISAGTKGLRSVRVAGQSIDDAKKIRSTFLNTATNAITEGLAKTPEQISASKSINNFFDWTSNKSGWEIAQHPIWGTGRRTNPARYQLSDLLSQADNVEKPLILRFAMGDDTAGHELAIKNSGLLAQLGRASDNRQLVDSVKFDGDLFNHFMQEERAGRAAAATPNAGVLGVSPNTLDNRIVEAPYPRPTTPGPRQAGWDAMYGKLQENADLYRKAAGDIIISQNGVRPMGAAANTLLADQERSASWKAGQLTSLDAQIGTMQAKGDRNAVALGGIVKKPEDFSPGESNLFGTVKNLYRMGPLALRDTEKGGALSRSADRKIAGATRDRSSTSGFVARTIREGYYNVPLRVIQAFGDRLPETLVNHNDVDAADRVADMLKGVPSLGQDVRLGMINAYSAAPDKVTRAATLKQINQSVIEHMAAGKDLSYDAAKAITQAVETGKLSTMNKLMNKSTPNSQMFSAAQNKLVDSSGNTHRADMIEDGEGWVVSPIAKTQLAYSEPLLDVKELGRFLDRNSGYLQSIKASGGNMVDAVRDISDGMSNVWKAATLLRPGYVLRAPSEEMAASAIKFGLTSSIMDSVHGGKNWALNRNQQLRAFVGKGSYSSTTGGKQIIRVVDPAAEKLSKELFGKISRINVSKAWPVVMDRIDQENVSIKALQKRIDAMAKDKDHDPNELLALKDDLADHQNVLGEHVDYSHELLRNATDATGRRIGAGTIEHRGITVPQAFSREWDNPIPRDQISSDTAWQTLFARGEAIDTARMIKTGNWVGIHPDEPGYMKALLDALNKQWGQDDLFKRVAGDMTGKDAAAWLKTEPGRFHASALGPVARDQGRLLQGIKDTLSQYTANNPVLLDKIAKGEEISESEVRAAIQQGELPVVHGEEVKGYTKDGRVDTAVGRVDSLIEKGFRRLGTIPTDIMSRHPTYLRAQEARMRQLIDQELSYQKSVGKPGDTIEPKALNAMLKKSDMMARKDISQIVYDPTRTTATQALRFVAPFLSAHIDGLERWGGLIAEKPQFIGTAAKIYNAPVAANLITDRYGAAVDESGYAPTYDENGKVTGKHFVPIQDRTIHMKVPPGARSIVGALTGTSGKEVPIKIQALNTILPGDPWWNPGTGPVVSIGASELVKKYPGMGDFLQWAKVLPYGPQGVMDSVTPSYIKNIWTASHPDGADFQKNMLAEYQRQVADYANGGPPPSMELAEKNAKKFSYLKALVSWVTPAQTQMTPLTGTPYQFYIDQYKKLQQADPKNADATFLQRYGSDYFIFTTSLSKSIGIAPTMSALNTSKEYKDLIAKNPELAPFIIGDTFNKGDFSPTAYALQQQQTIGGQKVRTTTSVQDAVTDAQRRLGWASYNKVMSNLDAALIRSGFQSYTQSGAEMFLAQKQNIQQAVGSAYPAWFQDFSTTDTSALPRRIQAFEQLVQDPRLKGDPMRQDIPALTQYLAMRELYKQSLSARGESKLSFSVDGSPMGQNQDIAQSWRAFQFGLIASNTKFGDVFHRYLSNDNLQ